MKPYQQVGIHVSRRRGIHVSRASRCLRECIYVSAYVYVGVSVSGSLLTDGMRGISEKSVESG